LRPGPDFRYQGVGSPRACAFGFGTAEHDGRLPVLARARQSAIRASAGKRIRLHIAVHDYAGHTTLVDRYFTLGR
jgi:hypothetical protein